MALFREPLLPIGGDGGLNGTFGVELDLIGGVPLPDCSSYPEGVQLPYATVVSTYIALATVCAVFGIVVAWKYNSVRVFNLRIRTPEISNTLWILFFASLFARAALDTVRFGLSGSDPSEQLSMGLFIGSLVMEGLAILCLALSLLHQYRYRSNAPRPSQPLSSSGSKSDVVERTPASEWIRQVVFSVDTLFFLVFIGYLVVIYLNVTDLEAEDQSVFDYVFLGAFSLLRLPVVVLTLLIVFHRSTSDGPTGGAKLALLVGTLLNTVLAVPPSWWARLSEDVECMGMFSLVDILQLLHILSLFFYFAFLRTEYKRNMEECIWTTVSRIQDTFDFRRF